MIRLLTLPKLREILDDTKAFGYASGDMSIYQFVKAAIEAAEKHEPPTADIAGLKVCLSCGYRTYTDERHACEDDDDK